MESKEQEDGPYMAPIKAGKYEYRPETLAGLREQLALKQTKMAELLGIPANTLSRWETGATTPDAEALASIYSLALERGITPNFFNRRRPGSKPSTSRSTLLAMWDFQNVGIPVHQVKSLELTIRGELDKRFARASHRLFKAFANPNQAAASDELLELGWRVWEDDEEIDDEIIAQAKSDCGQDPEDTILVLIAQDGDYLELIRELREQGVSVYLFTRQHEYSQRLAQVVPEDQLMKLSATS
jgi:transcriptional regulator with XRE-family HTH domain